MDRSSIFICVSTQKHLCSVWKSCVSRSTCISFQVLSKPDTGVQVQKTDSSLPCSSIILLPANDGSNLCIDHPFWFVYLFFNTQTFVLCLEKLCFKRHLHVVHVDPEHRTETYDHCERRVELNQKQHVLKKQKSSHANFEKELVGAMMMPYEQKPKTYALIPPDTATKIESTIEKRADGNYCTNCGYTSKHTGHMREHVKKHIEGLEYPCNSCNKILRSSNTFRSHIISRCPSLKSS